jgi:hypothetical protein
MPELGCNDFIQAAVTVKVKVIRSPQEMHGEDQTHQTEIMVAVEMGNENVVNAMKVGLETHQLHLRTLAAIDKEETILYLN